MTMTPSSRPGTDAHPYFRLHRTEVEGCYRRFVDDVVTERRLEVLDDLVSEEFRMHRAGKREPIRGPEGLKAHVSAYHRAFPDLTCDLESVVIAGTQLAGRWTMTGTHAGPFRGSEPTGAEVTLAGMDLVCIENDEFVERWEVVDTSGGLEGFDPR